MTLGELMGDWSAAMRRRHDLTERSKEVYDRVARHFARWNTSVQIVGADLGPYVEHRRRMNAADRTLRMELRVLACAVKWARRQRLIGLLDEVDVPRIKVDPNLFVINHSTPTPQEAGRVLASMDDDDWRLAMLLLARTGARVGEIAALRRKDFDPFRGTLRLGATRGNAKTGVRTVPLDRMSLADLRGRGRKGGTARLLELGRLANPRQGLRRRLTMACERAGVRPFTPHGLRRMVVGRLIRANVDVGTAAALTGHSVKIMLEYYQVVTDEDRRVAIEQARLWTFTDVE